MYGLPLFEARPLHSALPAVEVTDALRDFAAEQWSALSADERRHGDWRRTLQSRWKKADLVAGLRRQAPEEMERAIEYDLATARDLLREKVSPRAGNHFCLPFSAGSELTVRAATRLGLASISWGTLPGRRDNRPGDDPLRILRIKSDFLWRLPGTGRNSLANIYGRKLLRRLSGERVY
jgi:hypothetical protein